MEKTMEKTMKKQELELGKYLESDLIELTDENVHGGTSTPATPYFGDMIVGTIVALSHKGCPTTACSRAC